MFTDIFLITFEFCRRRRNWHNVVELLMTATVHVWDVWTVGVISNSPSSVPSGSAIKCAFSNLTKCQGAPKCDIWMGFYPRPIAFKPSRLPTTPKTRRQVPLKVLLGVANQGSVNIFLFLTFECCRWQANWHNVVELLMTATVRVWDVWTVAVIK